MQPQVDVGGIRRVGVEVDHRVYDARLDPASLVGGLERDQVRWSVLRGLAEGWGGVVDVEDRAVVGHGCEAETMGGAGGCAESHGVNPNDRGWEQAGRLASAP